MIRSVAKPSAISVSIPQPSHGSFEDDLRSVSIRLRGELAALVAALPNPVNSGADLKRQLGLANTVCWQLHSFIISTNPVAAIGQVPGRTAMTRLVHAAAKLKLDPVLLQRVESAFDQFESFTKEHASDRATLTALASGLSLDDGVGDLRWRRSALRDNSHIWGVQAQTTLLCAVLHESGDTKGIDALFLGGFAKVHALRKNVPLRLMVRSGTFDSREAPSARTFTQPTESFILENFSTRPLPRIDTTQDSLGMLETSLHFDGIGKAAAIDIFTAKVVRNASKGEPQPWHGCTKTVTIPSEVLLLDLLVPRGWVDPATVRTSTHGNPAVLESLIQRVPEFEMPIKETAVYSGNDLRAFETADIPRYPDMLRSALDQCRWSDTTYDIFRCRVKFPIMHSLVHMRVDTVQ